MPQEFPCGKGFASEGLVVMIAVLRLILCFAVFLFVPACEHQDKAEPASPLSVGIFPVREKYVRLNQTFSGRTTPYNAAEIRPQINGIIQQRFFTEGAMVREGDPLYAIDPAPHAATLEKAVAKEKSLEVNTRRYKNLLPSKSVSYQDYEDSFYLWQQAKAEVAIAELTLRYCTIKAPLAGKIGKSVITMGALAVADQKEPLTTILQLDPIFVDINPEAAQAMRFIGTDEAALQSVSATLGLESGQSFPHSGKITFVDNHIRQDTNTIGIRLEFPNPDFLLLPGMFVRITIFEKTARPYCIVPQQAVSKDAGGQTQVWVVTDGNVAELRRVTQGQSIGNVWVVLEGLSPGENVVTEGQLRLRPGMAVTPREAKNVRLMFDFSGQTRDGPSPNDP